MELEEQTSKNCVNEWRQVCKGLAGTGFPDLHNTLWSPENLTVMLWTAVAVVVMERSGRMDSENECFPSSVIAESWSNSYIRIHSSRGQKTLSSLLKVSVEFCVSIMRVLLVKTFVVLLSLKRAVLFVTCSAKSNVQLTGFSLRSAMQRGSF